MFLHQTLAFTNPSSSPTGDNVPLPINTSSNQQAKQGPLGSTKFQDTNNTTYFLKPGGTSKLGGTLNLSSSRIKNVQDPTDPQDVATKGYVDGVAGSIDECPGYIDDDDICQGTTICGVSGDADCGGVSNTKTFRNPTRRTYLRGSIYRGTHPVAAEVLRGEATRTMNRFCQEEGYSQFIGYNKGSWAMSALWNSVYNVYADGPAYEADSITCLK